MMLNIARRLATNASERWLAKAITFALLVYIIVITARKVISFSQAHSSSSAGEPQPRGSEQLVPSSSDLGVRIIRPVFAVIPEMRDVSKNVTVALTIWLKRVGARAAPYDLPHQTQDSIRMVVWVDDPSNLHNRQWGHLKLPEDHSKWMPDLLLETVMPGPILRAEYEPKEGLKRKVIDHIVRPYSFRVDLPEGVGNCFKIIEASYPKHKAPVCLPPARLDPTCDWLAPPGQYDTSSPALYTAIGAVRHTSSTGDWAGYQAQVAAQVWNYVNYQMAMGAAGLLLYADELQRMYLERDPYTAELLRRGHLKLITWDMPERGHDDDDGRGRPLGYNYDQALFASHVNLGLSSCGSNLWVLVTDIDEYVYIPKPNRQWPEPLQACMANAGPNITLYSLQRFEVLSSTIPPEEERKYWATPGMLGRTADGGGNSNFASANASGNGALGGVNANFLHPLEFYDQMFAEPLSRMHGKAVMQPAAGVVLFFVHDAVPLYGTTQLVHHNCMVLLHVPNFHGGRRKPAEAGLLQPIRSWVFAH
ncbi:hypothetical protein VOLCADRAFT_98583 [Volvox carteri f. nagariensis]|uniref:Glycosyltransferase family 92 protein n=1 Tax=Volvox carteri f. nagariensis TaxID=3068 RepID=D8UFR0_VOLCA|nr:uncharacterized protein VOLCADRAFT_98583 [Volvox carteri f. nagariensis]EFJ41422.1 hypothetical protein VOLCADRAFT_98583 [Volvox carteri f. nagariensis]|eukprot:XP_002957528.1 hypothetical protein VOLCADRAFT_98583 [Volvox carteri f. nagariensis]